jgi:hypothetical protein
LFFSSYMKISSPFFAMGLHVHGPARRQRKVSTGALFQDRLKNVMEWSLPLTSLPTS